MGTQPRRRWASRGTSCSRSDGVGSLITPWLMCLCWARACPPRLPWEGPGLGGERGASPAPLCLAPPPVEAGAVWPARRSARGWSRPGHGSQNEPGSGAGTGQQCDRVEEGPAASGESRATALSALCAPSRLLSLSGPWVLRALMTIAASAVGCQLAGRGGEPRTLSPGEPLFQAHFLAWPTGLGCPRQAGTPTARDHPAPDRCLHLGASQPAGSPVGFCLNVRRPSRLSRPGVGPGSPEGGPLSCCYCCGWSLCVGAQTA